MPLPEVGTLQQGDVLDAQRNQPFETENLPSPAALPVPQIAPIPIPGTGLTRDLPQPVGGAGSYDAYVNSVLGTPESKVKPGQLPQYTASDVYNPHYSSILPGEDSEEAFAKAQPWYTKWGNALVKMGATAVGTFWNGMTAIPDTIASLKSGSPYNTDSGARIDTWLKNLEDQFPNYYTKWEQTHPFLSAIPLSGGSANFWGDKMFKNFGFTLGAIGSAAVTDLAIGAVTEGIGELPLIGQQVGRISLALNKIFAGSDDVAQALQMGRNAGQTGKQLLNLERIQRSAAAAKITNGARFAINLYGAAASEAGFEARDGYNTVRQDLIQAFEAKNGYLPLDGDLAEIEKTATASANTRFGINLAVLALSDAIQFDSFLKPFSASRSGWRSSIQKELEGGLGSIRLQEGSIDAFERAVPKNLPGKIWGKLKPLVPAILSEGVYEEGGQYAAQVGTKNYYERRYMYDKGVNTSAQTGDKEAWDARNDINNILHSTVNGLAAEFGTQEGLENILLGGLTGAISGGVEHFMDRKQSAQDRQMVLTQLNKQGVTGTIKQNYDKAVESQRIAEDMKQAVKDNDIFKYKNFQHEQFAKFIISGARAGRYDVRLQQIDLLKDMPDSEFKTSFGLDKTTDNVKTVTQYIDLMKSQAASIKRTYDLVNNTFENPFRFNSNAKTREQSVENEKQQQFEDWKDDMTYLSTIAPNIDGRLSDITNSVRDISPLVSMDQITTFTDRNQIKEYAEVLNKQASILEEGLKNDLNPNKASDRKRLNKINSIVKSINTGLANNNVSIDKQQQLFTDMLNHEINADSDESNLQVPPAAIPQLMKYGVDANRLNRFKADAAERFESLSSEAGFNKYFEDIKNGQTKNTEQQAAQTQKAASPTAAPIVNVKPATTITVTNKAGEKEEFEKGKDTFVNLTGKTDENPEKVTIIDQTKDGIVVQKADGTKETIDPEVLLKKDDFEQEINKDVNDVTSLEDVPPDEAQSTNEKSDRKKDVSFGYKATTDPPYDSKTTPDNNFQRRHQSFLFDLGSTDPKVFNQENKPNLRIMPVSRESQTAFGFNSDFISKNDSENNDTGSIRAVYVIEDRKQVTKDKTAITKGINKIKDSLGVSYIAFEQDKEAFIDFIYQQLTHRTGDGQEAAGFAPISSLYSTYGEDLLETIRRYKENNNYFFSNSKGEKMGRVGNFVDATKVIYTNLADTSLTFNNGPRFTNKLDLDEKAVQDAWREQRGRMLNIDNVADTPVWNFRVSRGFPNVQNYDERNPVTEVGLITKEDLDQPVITVTTLGTTAVVGAFNKEGQGIASASTGVNVNPGRAMLNFGGNLTFLNARKLSLDEANNIFQILRLISDRKQKGKSGMFKYLNKVIFLTNPAQPNSGTDSSITIDKSNLYLGTSKNPILLSPSTIDASKDQIMTFIQQAYHNVNVTELNRIKSNVKAGDLEFREMSVKEGQIVEGKLWKNYNHYLLSNENPDGSKRDLIPLTTNIVIPAEKEGPNREIPIIQKYSYITDMDFEPSQFTRPQQAIVSTTVTPPKSQAPTEVKKTETQQGVKVEKGKIQFIDINGQKFGFSNPIKDANGNITDLTAVGRIQDDGSIIPYKNPESIKSQLLDILRDNQVTKDQTNTPPSEFSFLDNKEISKPNPDSKYRLFPQGTASYKMGNIDKEFEEMKKLIPDSYTFHKIDHLLRTTSGGLAWGAVQDSMIYVYKGAEIGTTYHEAFEVIWGNFLTGKEQQDLYNEFVNKKGQFTTQDGKKKDYSEASLHEAKEEIAEQFRDYRLNQTKPEGKLKTFFDNLIKFIRKVILDDRANVIDVFKRINKGYYRNYSTSTKNINEPQYREKGLNGLSEAFVQDLLEGMTSEMFMKLYGDNSDIITQLEQNIGTNSDPLYDHLKARLTNYFENKDQIDTYASFIAAKYQTLTSSDDKEALKQQYTSTTQNWNKVKDNWDDVVVEHKKYLKPFGIEFEINEDGDLDIAGEDEKDAENRSQAEYDRDTLKIDAKSSASSRVKLFLFSIADSVWKNKTGEDILIRRDKSLVSLPKLAPYAKLFNYMLHSLSNINGIYEMWDKLVEMTGQEGRKTIDANVQRVMNRLRFENYFADKTINQIKMLTSIEGAMSKQKPAYVRQFTDRLRNTFFKTSVVNSKIDQVKSEWISGIKNSGVVTTTPNNAFVFSRSIVGVSDPISFLNKLGIDITKEEYNRLKGKNLSKFDDVVNKVRGVVEKAAIENKQIPILSSKGIDFDSRLNELGEIYVNNISGDDTQSQHSNLDNEQTTNFPLPSFLSTILSDANNSATREEFINKINNQFYKDLFHQDSYILNNVLFDQDGKYNKPVEMTVVEGRESWDQANRAAASMVEAERQLYEINNNINGVFYTLLPADAKTEWAVSMGTYLSVPKFFGDEYGRRDEITKFANQMYQWLGTEVKLAKDYDKRTNITALNREDKDTKRPVGKSLRFFKDILSKDKVNAINARVIDGNEDISTIISPAEMRSIMIEFVNKKAAATKNNLLSWDIIAYDKVNDEFKLNGFDKQFLDDHFGKKSSYSSEELGRLLQFREMNYVMNSIEMHKMFFGDPAQYKDELKRIKSFLSGREATHVDTLGTSEGYNQVANQLFNKVSVNGPTLKIGDPGYQQHKNHFNTFTTQDVDFQSNSLEEIKKAIGDKASKPYTKGVEADAAAYMMASAHREMMYKAAGRYTAEQEKYYQWAHAWERNDKAKDGLYKYTDKELEKADNELLKEPEPFAFFQPLKLIHSGIQYVNGVAVASLDKASWTPMFYKWFKDNNLGVLYNEMQKRGTDYVRMESAHKVGIQNNSITALYNEKGNINLEGIRAMADEQIPLKTLGIQVEQQKKDKGTTEGSQPRVLIGGDMMNNGVPIDYKEDFTKWNELTDVQKDKASPMYKALNRHDKALIALTNARTSNKLKELGAVKDENGDYVIRNKKRVSDFILREITRRSLPINLAYGLEVNPLTGEFEQALEANAQYSKIRSVIYSIIDDTIQRPKVNGSYNTMMAVTGLEKSARIVSHKVNGKPVYTSDTLKFYTRDGKDGRTTGCEVMLPYFFGKKLREAGSDKTQEEVIKYLNSNAEGRKLLSGLGFRIPTQGLNSIDFFTVKGFLPEQMGSVIVLPSEITVKAGSDFDIDKLSTYLRNFYVGKDGFPHLVRFENIDTNDEQALKDYYEKYMLENHKRYTEYLKESDAMNSINALMKSVVGSIADGDLKDDTLDYVPTLEEFILESKGKDAYELNNIDALQNEYFDSMEDLLSMPTSYERLVTPNNADELKGLRNEVLALEAEREGDNTSGLGEYGRMLDSNFMMKERQAYISSKKLVGIAAVGNTFHVLSQRIQGGLLIRNSPITPRFQYNQINGQIALGGLNSATADKYISNIISQVIDGGVDVAKDKFLAEMGITNDTVRNFLMLVRMGATPKWAVMFLNQPAIKEYLKQDAIHKSVGSINPRIKKEPAWKLLNRVKGNDNFKGFKAKQLADKPNVYTVSEMEEMIKEPNLSADQRTKQIQMLEDYIAYDKFSWELFAYYQGYNWNSEYINDPNQVRLKEIAYDKANDLKLTPVSQLMKDTFMGSFRDNTLILDEALRSLINVQTGEASTILDQMAQDLSEQYGLSKDARKQLLLAGELSMVDFAVQTNSNIAGKPMNVYMNPLITGPRSTARYVEAIQKSADKRLANNPFVKNLLVEVDKRDGYPSTISLKEKDYDTYTSNVWTDAFRELRDDVTVISINNNKSDDRTVGQIYNNLVITAILQSGSKRTSNSMSHLIPNESYSEFTKTALRNLMIPGFYENNAFYRSNWNNSRLVPLIQEEQLDRNNPLVKGFYKATTGKMIEIIKATKGSDFNVPMLLDLQAWGHADKKVVKWVNDKDEVLLFERVDIEGVDGLEPLVIRNKRVVFKQINAWGEPNKVQEYHVDVAQSTLPTNVKVDELSNDEILYAMSVAGIKNNSADQAADALKFTIDNEENITDDNEDDDITDQSDPAEPTDPDNPTYFQLDSFEDFKNRLTRKNC